MKQAIRFLSGRSDLEIDIPDNIRPRFRLRAAVEIAAKMNSISGANLTGADLTDANLMVANLDGTCLARANLSGARLTCANLSKANLCNSNLTSADLINTYLSHAELTYANFTGAALVGAAFDNADLASANLTRANLLHAWLFNANLTDARLFGAKICDDDGNRNVVLKKVFDLGIGSNGFHRRGVVSVSGKAFIWSGCHIFTPAEARKYWKGNPDRREALAALDYFDALVKLEKRRSK